MALLRVRGGRELQSTLRAAGEDLGHLDTAAARTAALIAGAASGRAPRRSGRLAGSVHGTETAGRAVVSAAVVYSGVIGYGWPARRIRPNPFIVDAAQALEPAWVELYTTDAQAVLDKITGA